MNQGRIVFDQLVDCLPKYEFDKCVHRYRGNFRVRSLLAYEPSLVDDGLIMVAASGAIADTLAS
jgi:hypothetical protein